MSNKTIYVTGATRSASVAQLNEFAIVSDKLTKLGFTVYTAAEDIPMGDQLNDAAAIAIWLNKRMDFLESQQLDIVLHLRNFTHDSIATAEVIKAKYKNLLVMDSAAFIDTYTNVAREEENLIPTANEQTTQEPGNTVPQENDTTLPPAQVSGNDNSTAPSHITNSPNTTQDANTTIPTVEQAVASINA